MIQLPSALLSSIEQCKGFEKESFVEVHSSGEQVTSIRINPIKVQDFTRLSFADKNLIEKPVPWSSFGYYLRERPSFTFDPSFHAGCYYVQEASSMFLEQALKQTIDLSASLKVLDLSAAPGGKSTHIHSLLSKNSLLVSNEVIRSRANILKDNIIKWGCGNVVVTNNDPKDFRKLENYFDLIVVDAPCSGSGLFRRDPEAIAEWSPNNVALCSQRQQRILADIWPALKKDGVLIYSTCSYSKEENEDIVDWMRRSFALENLRLDIGKDWGIVESDGGYRFWPGKVKGEGFFISCLRKQEDGAEINFKLKKRPDPLLAKERKMVQPWMAGENMEYVKYMNTVYAWPANLAKDFSFLLQELRVLYSGTVIGELMREKLVPDHALAMSYLVSSSIERIELNLAEAIQYLQRKELKLSLSNKGWKLVNYLGNSLGWINVLTNRINNYYPNSLRILKEN